VLEPPPGERELLAAASILYDVGKTFADDDHHKHSQYLTVSAKLPGFDPRERALIAQISRYHRKGTPKLGELDALAEPGDEELLERCSVILRLAEHLGLWPLVAITDRVHPARQQLPQLSGNRAAYLQAAWRHLLFGLVLGELERRVNADSEPARPAPASDYSSNGHGSLQHAVTVAQVADAVRASAAARPSRPGRR